MRSSGSIMGLAPSTAARAQERSFDPGLTGLCVIVCSNGKGMVGGPAEMDFLARLMERAAGCSSDVLLEDRAPVSARRLDDVARRGAEIGRIHDPTLEAVHLIRNRGGICMQPDLLGPDPDLERGRPVCQGGGGADDGARRQDR